MKILFEISHPAHVHFFKNAIWNLENRGHKVLIVARDKDVTLDLLNAYKLDYKLMGKNYTGLIDKAFGLIKMDYVLLKIVKTFKPAIFVGRGSPYLAHISTLVNKPYIAFVDTEHANLVAALTLPLANVICTPSCFKRKLNPKKHLQFNGYKELAYLHPNYFKPDPRVLDDLGLSKDDEFIIMRLISWEAIHDTHSKGFSQDFLEKGVKSLEKYGHVFITSEQKLNANFEKYKIQIPPEKIHSALYYASLYFGEGGTTAVEAALLGTPAVHVEAFRTKSGEVVDATQIHGNFDELVKKYKILYTFADQYQAFRKALEILEDTKIKKEMERKREKLLKEKIDVTAFMTEFIENYPDSLSSYKGKTRGNKSV